MTFRSKAESSQGALIQVEIGTLSPKTITGISKADPGVVTSNAHGLAAGTPGHIASVVGMTELNGNSYLVANPTTNNFELDGQDTTDFTTYTSGGTFAPVDFASACEAKTFTGFDGQASEIDVTTMCSTAKEYRPGLQDFGSFNFSMNYVPTDPAQLAMQDAKAAGTSLWFNLILPGSLGTWVFQAFVRQMTITGGVDTALSSDVVLRITGAPTFVQA
jgi:hypothetical protein